MAYAPNENWDLDALFPGGPGGTAFLHEVESVEAELRDLIRRSDALPPKPHPADLASVLLHLERVSERLGMVATFAGCSVAADANGKAAVRAQSKASELGSLHGRASVTPNARILHYTEAEFETLLAFPDIAHMRNYLRDLRRLGRLRLPEAEESLANELTRDGDLVWGELYDLKAIALRLTVDRGNGPEELSPGQATSLLSHPDPLVRESAFAALQAAWRSIYPECAKVLTHITGTRQVLNDRRRLDPLDEPLAGARVERATVEALMHASRRARPLLNRYLVAKAKALGKPKLAWTDLGAPLGKADGGAAYPAAQEFIVDQFAGFSTDLAEFARRSFKERWVEVEDRAGKRGGGFCAEVPALRQSRIFMTWGNNARSVATLAHELGHAYHNHVLFVLPASQRRVPMTLAETASTFGETLVREASLAATRDPEVKLRLLDASLGDALAYLANVPARFELEQALYRMRCEGPLDPEAIEQETNAIFSRWYGDGVEAVDPTFWSSKLHFYIPEMAFYNFPYTFGYLFSALVYEFFKPQGRAGAPGYVGLLRRTGDEWAERIARDALGVELADPETWAAALGGVERDLVAFERLVG